MVIRFPDKYDERFNQIVSKSFVEFSHRFCNLDNSSGLAGLFFSRGMMTLKG